MVIGVDGNEANVDTRVGTSVYTYELLKYFSSVATENQSFIIYLREKKKKHMPKTSDYFRYEYVKGKRLWRDIHFPKHLFLHRHADILFSPAHYTPRFSPIPVVVTLHDLGYEHFPNEFLKKDLYKLKKWTRHAVKQAIAVISVSNATQKDARKYYYLEKDKAHVVYNGFKKYTGESADTDETLHKYNLHKNTFILTVGTLQPRKNIARLIDAFSEIHKKHPEIKLCLTGKKGWMYTKMFKRAHELNLSSHVIFAGYVPDDELKVLYKNAKMCALPGLYEGFGIPVLEAMQFGTPVACANAASLPEVGGDACVYFNPRDTMDMAKVITKVLTNIKLRNSMSMRGKHHVKQFSWEKCGQETLDVITKALST